MAVRKVMEDRKDWWGVGCKRDEADEDPVVVKGMEGLKRHFWKGDAWRTNQWLCRIKAHKGSKDFPKFSAFPDWVKSDTTETEIIRKKASFFPSFTPSFLLFFVGWGGGGVEEDNMAWILVLYEICRCLSDGEIHRSSWDKYLEVMGV